MISIITINRNNISGLEDTFKSMRRQLKADIEYIVIDGSSTDGSVQLILANQGIVTSWISEPDFGIYNAMNKGILKAKGDFCLFLNSGDCLTRDDILADIEKALDDKVDILYSDAVVVQDGKSSLSKSPRHITPGYFLVNTLNHQNAVIRRDLLLRLGLYREDFRIASDWYLFLKASVREKPVFQYYPKPIVRYVNDGISASVEGASKNESERRQGIMEVFSDVMPVADELRSYQDSVYGSIIRHYGDSRALQYLLRAYRFAVRSLARFSKS